MGFPVHDVYEEGYGVRIAVVAPPRKPIRLVDHGRGGVKILAQTNSETETDQGSSVMDSFSDRSPVDSVFSRESNSSVYSTASTAPLKYYELQGTLFSE